MPGENFTGTVPPGLLQPDSKNRHSPSLPTTDLPISQYPIFQGESVSLLAAAGRKPSYCSISGRCLVSLRSLTAFFEYKGLLLWHIVVFVINDINNYDEKSFLVNCTNT